MKQSINKKYRRISTLLLTFIFALCAVSANAQTTTFTYQGRFTDTTVQQPTNGTYTMTFRLFNAETGGTQIGADITSMVSVVNNLFTAKLNFGAAAFATSGARYLEIQVGSTVLTPRQEITAAPFATRAVNAGSADSLSSACVGCVTNAQIASIDGSKVTGSVANANALGGIAANQFVQTNDSRLSDARTPTAGSANYIQNGTTQQASSNFNISGNGTVGGTLSSTRVSVTGGVLARGGAPGGFGTNNNGYAFTGNSGDNDSGLFSEANGRVSLFTDNVERVRTDSNGISVTGNINATGTISGTLANDSVGTAQVANGSLRLSDTSVFGGTASFGPVTIPAHGCARFNINLNSGTTEIGDILYFYPSNITPAGFYIQPTITTSLTANPFYICNTLNTSNTFPAQTIRYNFVRP